MDADVEPQRRAIRRTTLTREQTAARRWSLPSGSEARSSTLMTPPRLRRRSFSATHGECSNSGPCAPNTGSAAGRGTRAIFSALRPVRANGGKRGAMLYRPDRRRASAFRKA